MPLCRAQVTFPAVSAIPADAVTNTWHFDSYGPEVDFQNVADMLKDFYSKTYAALNPISYYLASGLSNVAEVRIYKMSDPKPRPPAFEGTFELGRPSGITPIPTECAVVLSFQATRQAGMPQSRRRNRVYLGPFSNRANGSDGRPSPGLKDSIARAAKELLDAAQASVVWSWAVYSPTNDAYYNVNNGWIDDAWDTQRRRGLAPTSRVVWDTDTP